MRALLALPLLVLPAAAQDVSPPGVAPEAPLAEDGPTLMEEGMRLFMEGLSREIAPMLDDLEAMRREAAPLLEQLEQRLGEALGGLDAYHPPEILPNGDIILRRRAPSEDRPSPEAEPVDPDGDGAIEL